MVVVVLEVVGVVEEEGVVIVSPPIHRHQRCQDRER